MKTADVRSLVLEVLESIPEPYSHDIIDEVFAAIERTPDWRGRYESLCTALSKDVVNNWGGRWVAISLGKVGEEQLPSKKSTLIGSYSVLDTDSRRVKRTDDDVRKMMSDYYHAHRDELPRSIRDHRGLILSLLHDGLPVREAFALALEDDSTKSGR